MPASSSDPRCFTRRLRGSGAAVLLLSPLMLMIMSDARFFLVWPKDLFRWEARRVGRLPEAEVTGGIVRLLEEAFEDAAVVDSFRDRMTTPPDIWGVPTGVDRSREWLRHLAADESRLLPFVSPQYYAEREGHTTSPDNPFDSLGVQFATLLTDMQDQGYFPVALPRYCVDNNTNWYEVNERVRRAIHMPFSWDGAAADGEQWDEPLLLSLIEYFHDHAQRPRVTGYIHDYGDCGPHFDLHSAESGGAVYRWRVNELLDRHKTGLQLGRHGVERGRLLHRLGTPLDVAVDNRAAAGIEDTTDEVAHGIRSFRARGATVTQKKSALALLAGALEHRRGAVKAVLKKDEADLFRIANQFGIRHRRADQQIDYGDEFLDYMFSAFISAIMLMEALEQRPAPGP